MKVFLKKWRGLGFQCWIYLYNILLVASSPAMVQRQLNTMLQDLTNSGMVVNHKKSVLEPTQVVDHLGFTIDLKKGLLQVPQEKMKTI